MNKPIIIQELEEVLKHLKADTSRVERLIDVFKTSIIHDKFKEEINQKIK